MQIEEDLVEEVARVYGYNSIPDVPLRADLTMTNHKEANLPLKRIKAMLVDRGYQEAITYSFVDPKVQAYCIHNKTRCFYLTLFLLICQRCVYRY